MLITVFYKNKHSSEVLLLKHKLEESYSFVNLTKGHICPCKFASVQDALADLDKYKKEGKIVTYHIHQTENYVEKLHRSTSREI